MDKSSTSDPLDLNARPRKAVVAVIFIIVFGLMTLKSGGSVIFIDGPDRLAAGNYIPFVVWFNFLAGFAYIIAGIGFFLWRDWAVKLSLLIVLATILVFVIFEIIVLTGGEYEARTVGAMILRCLVWLVIYFLFRKSFAPASR